MTVGWGIKAGERIRTADVQLGKQRAIDTTQESVSTYKSSNPAIASNPDTSDEKTPLNPELQAIIEAWPSLPEPLRAAVLAIVRSGG